LLRLRDWSADAVWIWTGMSLSNRFGALWRYRVIFFLAALACGFGVCLGQTPSPQAYEDYAMRTDGDVERGRELFGRTDRALCAICHTVDGSGGRAGPDLFAIGDKFPRRELIRSILSPSSTIAVGYGTTSITRKSGGDVLGVIKQATEAWVELKGIDGKSVRVEANDIASQTTLPTSLMPEGLYQALSLEEFSNLIAYLEHLRQPRSGGTNPANTLDEVPRARKSATLKPFFQDHVRFEHPVWLGEMPGHPGVFLVLEHFGRAWVVERRSDGDQQRLFLDLRAIVRGGGATGLLAFDFHPSFGKDRRYYLKYQIQESGRISTIVEERRFSEDLRNDSGEAPRMLLKIPGVTQDHNGGSMAFGPDGYLYIGMGDTGPQRDPQGHGQDMSLLLGKLLRIDVNRGEGDRPYAIPADNPYLGREGVRPEIWASGFREPWRISFDSLTRDLWLGDVGQDQFEEVDIVRSGENHGWNVFEGGHAFSERYRNDKATYTPPVFSYPHRLGVSVTGGFVYRGEQAPRMKGWYVFADYESRRIWALQQADRRLQHIVEIGRAPTRAVSFAQLLDGELCLVGYDDGIIYKVGLHTVDPTPLEKRVLAETAETNPVLWRMTRQQPVDDWMGPDFDDSGWRQVPAGFGTQGTPGAIVRTNWATSDIWLRREFTLASRPGGKESSIGLRVHHDEDAEIYVNGVLGARLPRWTTGYVEVPLADAAVAALRPGRNVVAIHCHQQSGGQYIDAGLVEYLNGQD
jgi:putative heme-binding domain-containing protein